METHTETNIAQEARNAMAEQRLHDKHLEETMHGRTAAEVGLNKTN